MPKDEHLRVVRTCADQARGRVLVLAGAGSNDTRVAIDNIEAAKEAGADAALMVPPYYNRPNQEGIFRHFEAIVAACDLPIVLYNVPGRPLTAIAVAPLRTPPPDFPTLTRIHHPTRPPP